MNGRHVLHRTTLLVATLLTITASAALAAPLASDGIWQGLESNKIAGGKASTATFRLDKGALESLLARAPKEGISPLGQSPVIITLPMPDGSLARFRFEESSVFEPALAAEHPEIRSFRGQGIDLASSTVRFDWTPQGFHALMLASDLTVTVYPQTSVAGAEYVSTQVTDAKTAFACGVIDDGKLTDELLKSVRVATGDQLRTYRVAISTTGEFTQLLGGGTVSGALAALNTILNGINAVYERELAVHINLIAGLNAVIFTNGATDPYTNGNTGAMIDEVVAVLGANIPIGNYDFGHVIGTDSGGLAGVGVICNNTISGGGPRKAAAASGAGLPVGGSGNVSLIGHEIGHQFGAPHTQNSACNRSPLNAVETGSGVTIMSYSGVCPPNNTVPIGELRFHAWSLALMNAYISTQACQVSSASGNSVPTVNGGPDRTIPVNTPFTLTAVGNDANPADLPNLTYAWEQVDPGQLNGGATDYPNPPFQDQPGDPTTTTRPILTALATSSSPARTFPRSSYILNNANDPPDQVNGLFTAEELPRVGRTLNFRVTVRDNHAGAGGTNDDLVTLTVAGGSGPFQVTAPNGGGTWIVGSAQTVTWNVNNTSNAPVSCANVKLSLSTDGGLTFPIVLAASTPNDGSEGITVPAGLNTANARVKVEAVGNIFFDVSNADFAINAGPGCPFVTSILPGAGNAGASITLSGSGLTGVTSVRFSNNVVAVFNVVNDATITATIPAGAVSGPITLSKAACPDVITNPFTLCPNPSQLAQVDDGSGETFWGGSFFVNRLTPAGYPATLSQVRIQTNSFGVPAGTAMNVLIGSNPGGTTDLSGVVFQTIAGTTGPDGSFKAFDVPLLTIDSGDFVVGYNVTGTFPGFSDTGPSAGRSYVSGDGIFGSSTVASNHLIRAQYYVNCGSALACPAVSSLTPASGAIGSSVVIAGSNFTGVSAVRFANSVAAAFTVDTPGQITATVPVGAVTGPITIIKSGCTDALSGTFTVTTPSCPAVTNLAPTTGAVGSSVVLTGSNFTGTTSVTFTNSVAAVFSVDSPTQITATVPAGAVTGPISVAKSGCPTVQSGTFTVSNPNAVHLCVAPGTAIPDNNPAGITSSIVVPDNLTITGLTVTVNITHTYIGDLIVELRRGATIVRLHNQSGMSADNIIGTYPTTLAVDGPGALSDFHGQNSSGTWNLFISDNDAADVGSLVEWCLDITGTPAAVCPAVTNITPTTGAVGSNVVITGTNLTGADGVKFTNNVTAVFAVDSPTQITATVPVGAVTGPITITKAGCSPVQTATFTVGNPTVHLCAAPGAAIPDNDPVGITSVINVPDNLTVTSVTATVNIPHTFIGDLIVELRHGATTVRLHNRTGAGADNIVGTYPTTLTVDGPGALADFIGQSSTGAWTLFVSDNEGADLGTLADWCIDIQGTPGTTSVDPSESGLAFRIAPNPVTLGSTISFTLPRAGVTRVRIVDLAGRLVHQLQDGWIPAGPQQLRWDGRDRSGSLVESGIYFISVEGAGVKARGKLVVSR